MHAEEGGGEEVLAIVELIAWLRGLQRGQNEGILRPGRSRRGHTTSRMDNGTAKKQKMLEMASSSPISEKKEKSSGGLAFAANKVDQSGQLSSKQASLTGK